MAGYDSNVNKRRPRRPKPVDDSAFSFLDLPAKRGEVPLADVVRALRPVEGPPVKSWAEFRAKAYHETETVFSVVRRAPGDDVKKPS